MFFINGKINPYCDDLNFQLNENKLFNKQIDDIEINLKNKFQNIKEFNPDECFENSYGDINYDQKNDSAYNSDSSFDHNYEPQLPKKRNPLFETINQTIIYNESPHLETKLKKYKKLINFADLISSIILICGALLASYEQEIYYYHNIFYRVTGVVIINYVYNNPFNHSKKIIFDDSNVNMTLLTLNSDTSVEDLYIDHSFHDNSCIQNYTNEYFLQHLNFSKFNYIDNITDYSDIKIPLETSESSEFIRGIILILNFISLIFLFMSKHFEYKREYLYKKEQEISFYKTKYLKRFLIEILLIYPVPYPNFNNYFIIMPFDSTFCLPLSSIFAAFSIYRLIFIYKIIKIFSIWDSESAEKKCEKYSCRNDCWFAFKAMQRDHPFFTLFIISFLTCYCLGYSLRIFELHYWETQQDLEQNWRYIWNSFWCVFVTMTTVGYGDFYPKTHLGRIVILLSCVLGIYFVSMTMVFMTKKSVLDQKEQKAFKLITRINLRKQFKDNQAFIIFNFLKIQNLKNKSSDKNTYNSNFILEKRNILTIIDSNKNIKRQIKNFEFIPTKEILFDICEKIENDTKLIKNEINSISVINDSILSFSDTQIEMLKYLKKNIYSTKLLYETFENKNEIFGMLSEFDKNIIKEEQINKYNKFNTQFATLYNNINNNTNTYNIERQKSFLFNFPNYSDDENDECYADELCNYDVNQEEIKNHFYYIFFNKKRSDNNMNKNYLNNSTVKTVQTIRNLKRKQTKLKLHMSMMKSNMNYTHRSGITKSEI